MFYVFDIETLGVESTAVVLSAGIIMVEPETLSTDPNQAYRQLVDKSFIPSACFVKFKSLEQKKSPYFRTIDKSTLEWWGKQSEASVKTSLTPSSEDVSPPEGLDRIRNFIQSHSGTGEHTIWIRGSLDQMAIDSLASAYGVAPIAKYNAYRDIRTAIDLLFEDGKNGYVNVPGFEKAQVVEHDPVHDCARDALMLLKSRFEQ